MQSTVRVLFFFFVFSSFTLSRDVTFQSSFTFVKRVCLRCRNATDTTKDTRIPYLERSEEIIRVGCRLSPLANPYKGFASPISTRFAGNLARERRCAPPPARCAVVLHVLSRPEKRKKKKPRFMHHMSCRRPVQKKRCNTTTLTLSLFVFPVCNPSMHV